MERNLTAPHAVDPVRKGVAQPVELGPPLFRQRYGDVAVLSADDGNAHPLSQLKDENIKLKRIVARPVAGQGDAAETGGVQLIFHSHFKVVSKASYVLRISF
jgi:hypothetical protein